MTEPKAEQLRMLLSEERLNSPPAPQLPAGYGLRFFEPTHDTADYLQLMHSAGFGFFDPQRVEGVLTHVLPDGFFLVSHAASKQIVATALANHAPTAWCPTAGELGWVAASPAHAGRGLGLAVCAAAVNRLVGAGYRTIYLLTEDYRLPALVTYFRLGFVPDLYLPDMEARWEAVCEHIDWPFTPNLWPHTN